MGSASVGVFSFDAFDSLWNKAARSYHNASLFPLCLTSTLEREQALPHPLSLPLTYLTEPIAQKNEKCNASASIEAVLLRV
jgi:hypothetical protein